MAATVTDLPTRKRRTRKIAPAPVEAVEVNVCPICGAAGAESCVEEGGQFVLDHWGRGAETWPAVSA